MSRIIVLLLILAAASRSGAQQPPASSDQPQVKVNMLNVCTPSAEERQEIASALSKVPQQPLFGPDFEVARGRSSLDESANILESAASPHLTSGSESARWVRIRREFSLPAIFSTVQYSFSTDPKNMVETLVFRVRDPKDLLELTIEDSASRVTTPAAMLTTDTPASRIKLERFGKPSVVLARCYASEAGPAPDQSAYEPLFRSATGLLATYRTILGAKHTVPEELARVSAVGAKPKPKP